MAMSLTESVELPSESKTLITPLAAQDTIEEEISESNEDLNVSSTSAATINNEEILDSSNIIPYTEEVSLILFNSFFFKFCTDILYFTNFYCFI